MAFYLSGHGYGHMAQSVPLLQALVAAGCRVALMSPLPESVLRQRLGVDFVYEHCECDVGMVMHNSLDVDIAESLGAYIAFHDNWTERLAQERVRLAELKAECVISNVAYLPLQAAKESAIPAYAFCSLNWRDIAMHYFAHESGFAKLLPQIEQAYQQAEVFFMVEPSMPMPWLKHGRQVPPLPIQGDKIDLRQRLQMRPEQKLILLAMGGVETPLPVVNWPEQTDYVFLLNQVVPGGREEFRSVDELAMPFLDIVASVDAVVTKPGYGTIVQAVNQQVPCLYVKRGDWPEEGAIVHWLQKHGRAREIRRPQLQTGDFAAELVELLKMPAKPPPDAGGIKQILAAILPRKPGLS